MQYYDMVVLGMPGNTQARRREAISAFKIAFYIFSKKIKDTEKIEKMFWRIQNGEIPADEEIVENIEQFLEEIRNRKLIKIFE
jgi:deoxyhypusine synthase